MTSIPPYTIGGITRPELFLDPSGNIVLTPAAQSFVDTYGIKALYFGCPPGTPFPPVSGLLLTTPIDTDAATNTVLEGAAAGTAVHLTASAHDIVGFPITYTLTNNANGAFQIDAHTGVVTVLDPSKIDYESAPGHASTITVQASDGIFTSSQNFTIAVGNAPPSTPTDSVFAANTVVEGAANGTAVGVTVFATDVNGGAITYSLTNNASGAFAIDPLTGVITVADSSKIDFETAPGHAYTVTAQASDGTATSTQNFTIAVTDVPIGNPVDSNGAANTVAEGAANGSTVGVTASATDPNGPATTYSLIGDTSGGGFTINAATGVVTVADATKLDFESAPGHAYSVTVQAVNGNTTSQSFTIAVSDVAPSTPTDSNAAANTVVEGAANGSTVGVTAFSTDINGPGVTYSLVGDTSGGGFTINATTGVITVADANKINYETAPGHAYTVTAQSSDGTLTNSQTFTIAVSDVAPTAPVDSDGATNTVAEGAANGSTVGVTAFSTDINGPGVTYSLVGDTSVGGFTINATTGVITVADSTKLDYETTPGHAYTVTAQASDGTLTNSQTFTIALTDVAPTAPTDTNNAANTVAEGAANGSTVGITASSVDPNGPATIYSLSDNAGGRFAIDSSTGIVTVANGAAIDFETAAGHAYGITVLATNGALSTSTAFSIGVTDVGPSTPADANGAADSVFEGAANGTLVGLTASATDPGGGPAPTYTLTDDAGGRFAIDPNTGIVTVANGAAIDFETAAGHAYDITVQATAGALSTTHTFSIGVGDVNEAPAGTDKAVLIAEDNTYTFGVADFGFSDPADSVAPNSLLAVKITTVPGAGEGTLQNNGITVNAGDSVSAADIAAGHLVFTPTLNANGSPEATFTFQVQDDGGTANGGVDLDQSPNTFTINVNAGNDAPINSVPITQSVNEDSTLTFSAANLNAITISDVDVGSGDETVTLTVTSGVLALGSTLNLTSFTNNAASITLTGTVANVNAAMDGLTYHGNLNFNGADSLVVSTNDNGNTGAGGPQNDTDSITINVAPVNDAPVNNVPAAQTVNEDTDLVFTGASAITISDVDGGSGDETVTLTVASGALALGSTLNLTSFTNNAASITLTGTIANINAALDGLTYHGNANFNGADSLSIVTHDNGNTGGGDLADTDSVSINVTAVNDVPSFTVGANQTALEDSGAHTVNGFITGISPGPADEAGQAVNFFIGNDNTALFSVGPSIDASGNLTYTLAANANGSATVTVQIHDNGGAANGGVDTSTAQTFTIDATSVNDAPAGTDNSFTILEDGSHTFTAAEFGFTDPVDAANHSGANDLQAVIITTIPGAGTGTLTLNGGAVTAGQSIAVADIGGLVFTPAANANGNGEASFTFQVQDNGGTVNGGIDTDQTANTITFNVTSVNDAPAGTDSTISALGPHTFIAADFGFTDPLDVGSAAGANSLLAVEITTLPTTGSLTLNGAAVSAGDFISATDIGNGLLLFTPSGNAAANLTFQVQDDGGTANGGVDIDASPNTLTITQNTPPVAHDDSASATEAGGLNNALAGSNPTGNVILGTGVADPARDTDVEDASSALTVVAVHTGPEGASTGTGTVGTPLIGLHGTLTLLSDGSYTYLVNQSDPLVQALHTSAETIADVFNYTITDTGGLQDTATLTVTIHGADDLPQAVTDPGTMNQNSAPTSFNVIANDTQDPDHTATNAITVGPGGVTVTGPAGETFANTDATVAIVANQIQVTLNNSHFAQLAAGEHATVTVPYTLTGDAGETSSVNLVVQVDGVNDLPVAVDDSPADITEDQVGTFTVLANDTLDPDHGAPISTTVGAVTTSAVTNLVTPSAGENIDTSDITVSVNATNQVVVTLGADFQHMKDGEHTSFDIGYTLHGDGGDTSTATLHVTVDGVNDAPVAADFDFSLNAANNAIGNTDLVVNDPADGAPDPTGPQKTISGSLLSGATDVDSPASSLIVVAGTFATAHGGTVTMQSDGDFVYKPAVGYTGTDSFNYTVSDQNPVTAGTDTGLVTLNVASPHVWYVNADAASDGDGSSENPYNTLSHFAGAGGVDVAGDTIVLETASAHYTGGLTLENNEQLISQSAGVTINGTTLFAASGANAVLDGGLVLGSGNTIEGVDFGTNAGGFAVSGSGVGTLHLNDTTTGVISNASGGGISIAGAANVLNVDFNSITSGAGANGIALAGSSGTFHVHGGTISGASGADVSLSGGTLNFTSEGIVNDSTGTTVSISGMSGGIQDFNGSVTGGGVALASNTGATMRFDGGVFINTSATNSTGFSATAGGTVTVTGATNTINAGQGTAVDVENTTIGVNNLTFQSVSSSGGSANGIILSSTGSSGGLHVTGISNPASGGTIANKTGADGSSTQGTGIYLNNTFDVELNHMQLNNFQNFGIRGFDVNGFTLANSVVNATSGTNGNNAASDEGSISFRAADSAHNGLIGTVNITNSTIANGLEDNFNVFNNSGSLNITVSGSTFRDTSAGSPGNDGLLLESDNTANIIGLITNSSFLRNFANGVQVISNGSGNVDVDVGQAGVANSGGTFTDNFVGTNFDQNGSGTFNFNVLNAAFTTANYAALFGAGGAGSQINVNRGGGASVVSRGLFTGNIDNNTINNADSGTGPGISVSVNGTATGSNTTTVKIDSNNISHVANYGILVADGDGNGIVNATITNNTVSTTTAAALEAIRVNGGITSSQAGAPGTPDNGVLNFDIHGNTVSSDPSAGVSDIRVRQRFNFTDKIEGYGGSATDDAAVAAYLASLNTHSGGGAATVTADHSNTGFGTIVGVTEPPAPLMAALGGVQATTPTPGVTSLSQAELNTVVAAAIAQWAAAGASESQLALLQATTFSVADLAGNTIGNESSPAHITIDIDAAGHGWFVDATPGDNSEFTHALNAGGTDLLTDPSNAAAGHLDLLTTVVHEMGHVLGLPDSTSAADVNDLMYISLVDGERRLPDAADVTQASAATFNFQAVGATAPAPVVTGTSGNDTIDAGQGGKVLVGGAGADNFVFANVDVHAATPPAITHVADYSVAQGDTFDFSALTAQFHASSLGDAMIVRAVEDPSGQFATLQVNTVDSSLGIKVGSNWVNVAQLDGAHAGDAVNVQIDSHSAIHLAQIHAGLLV
jgi:VCBS repeat-containing protein